MRQQFRYALLAIPVVTIMTQVSLGAWQAQYMARLQDRTRNVIKTTLKLESQLGFGGLIHNFKNAILRPDKPEFITRTQMNADRAIQLIDELETYAQKLGISASLPETTLMVASYRARLNDLRNRKETGLSVEALDDLTQIDEGPALKEIAQYQNLLISRLQSSMKDLQLRTQTITAIITILALMGGYTIFMMVRNEQKRITNRDQAAHEKLLLQSRIHAANLERVNVSLQQFAGIAAHDLRAPTRQVLAFAELALDNNQPPEDRTEFVEAIRTSAIRMRDMVETLLGFAQKGFRNPERTDLHTSDLLTMIAAEKRNPETKLTLKTIPDIYADRELIARVFSNLIGNAEKYGYPDRISEITIDGWEADERIFFNVTDNGPGIDPAYADIIFRPFKRIGNTNTRGEGIGLSLVQSIINAHWGEIWLDTEHRDGARFVFWLPSKDLLPGHASEHVSA